MFMNVITGYLSKLKVSQCHILQSRSYYGQTKFWRNVYTVIYNIYAKHEKDKHNMVIEITQKKTNFEVLLLDARMLNDSSNIHIISIENNTIIFNDVSSIY